MTNSNAQTAAGRRPWIVLLYFYVAALVGLGFVIAGTTTALFGVKDVAFPQLGVRSYSYESGLKRDDKGTIVASDAERDAARQQAIDDNRQQGLDGLVNGVILLAVGTPTLVWHLRGARRAGARPEPTTVAPDSPTGS
ncbi:MAG TPA: hypothetical protein VL595_18735 [Pseudonocardia sp.]|jgi:hypothetical protein|nr:hypothetical protein [Pseudonocardia sp.]